MSLRSAHSYPEQQSQTCGYEPRVRIWQHVSLNAILPRMACADKRLQPFGRTLGAKLRQPIRLDEHYCAQYGASPLGIGLGIRESG